MPQMSPMNWFILFISFNIVFYICMIKLFFMGKLFKGGISIKTYHTSAFTQNI